MQPSLKVLPVSALVIIAAPWNCKKK